MGRLKIKRRVEWERVTNAIVIKYANPKCGECKGAGVLVNARTEQKRPCPCADPRFKEAFAGRLRRMDSGALEYRPLAVVQDIDDEGPIPIEGGVTGSTADSEPADPGSKPGPRTSLDEIKAEYERASADDQEPANRWFED